MSEREVITDEECALLLDCSVDQVRELAGCGDLPGAKIGRAWRFLRADVLAWLSARAKAEAEQRRSRRTKTMFDTMAEVVKPRRRSPPSLAFVNRE